MYFLNQSENQRAMSMQYLFLLILALTHLSVSTGNPIHFDSYHFEWNDQTQWSFNTDLSDFNSLTDERIACTVDVPSLCAMTIPMQPGFHIFYENQMLDFLNDHNWTQITLISPISSISDSPHSESIERRRLFENEESPFWSGNWPNHCKSWHCIQEHFDRLYSRQRRRRWARRDAERDRLDAKRHNARMDERAQQKEEDRTERAVYRELYKFGETVGRSIRDNDFTHLCGLTGDCGENRIKERELRKRSRRGRGRGRSGGRGGTADDNNGGNNGYGGSSGYGGNYGRSQRSSTGRGGRDTKTRTYMNGDVKVVNHPAYATFLGPPHVVGMCHTM